MQSGRPTAVGHHIFNQLLATAEDNDSLPDFNFSQLQMLCFRSGIPEIKGVRPVCYKLLLGYLPWDKRIWNQILKDKRALYYEYIREFLSPFKEGTDTKEDNTLLQQIDKDVRRTLVRISFFQTPIIHRHSSPLSPSGSEKSAECYGENVYETSRALFSRMTGSGGDEYSRKHDNYQDYHWESVERILFIYSKLNKAVGYVQGMNEILGPLYYVLANGDGGTNASDGKLHAEADSFWLFFTLISEIKDLFMNSMDRDKSSGIGAWLSRLGECLERQDGELWRELERKQINLSFFGFRWLSVLLAREFTLPDLIRIWDSLFADKRRFSFLLHICCAMILLVRDRILNSEYQQVIQLLQEYPAEIDLNLILHKAYGIYDEELVRMSDDGAGKQPSSQNNLQSTVNSQQPQRLTSALQAAETLTNYLYGLVGRKNDT